MRKLFSFASTAALAGAAVAGLAFMPSAGAGGADTLNCTDFEFQEDAQAVFDADPSDPHRLDQGGEPGIACEELPHRGGGPATTTAPTLPPTTTTIVCAVSGSPDPRCPRLIVRVPTAPPATVTPGAPKFTG
jgi:hypothetical protein